MSKRDNYRKGWIMYSIAAFFYFYDFILKLIPSIMMENIISRLDITTNQFGVLELSFYAVYTPMQLFCGPLLDEYGAKRVLPSMIGVCLIGSIMSGWTHSYNIYLLSRLMIGFGSAFAFVSVLKIASEWLPRRLYPFLSGLTTTFGMLGGIFSEAIAPLFNQYDQRYFFTGICIIAALLIVLSILFIEDGESHEDSVFDIKLILSDIGTVLSKPQIWLAGMIGLCLFTPIQLFVTWAIRFFSQDLNVNEVVAGNITSMLFWGACVFAPLAGLIACKINKKKNLLYVGNTVALVAMLLTLYSAHVDWISAMLLMFLVGTGVAVQPLVFVYASRQVHLHLTATAVASTNFIINLSSLAQPYVGSQLVETSKQVYSLASWRNALAIIPLLLLVNYVFIIFLGEIQNDDDN